MVYNPGKTIESNQEALKRFGFSSEELENRHKSDLVIIELGDWVKDRVRNAFNILQLSCTQNGLLLQWECEAVGKYFRWGSVVGCSETVRKLTYCNKLSTP